MLTRLARDHSYILMYYLMKGRLHLFSVDSRIIIIIIPLCQPQVEKEEEAELRRSCVLDEVTLLLRWWGSTKVGCIDHIIRSFKDINMLILFFLISKFFKFIRQYSTASNTRAPNVMPPCDKWILWKNWRKSVKKGLWNLLHFHDTFFPTIFYHRLNQQTGLTATHWFPKSSTA